MELLTAPRGRKEELLALEEKRGAWDGCPAEGEKGELQIARTERV